MKWIPDRKVWAGGVFAVLAYVLIIAANTYAGADIPLDAGAFVALAIGKAAEWFIPPAQLDLIKRLDNDLVEIAAASPASAVSPELQNVSAAIRKAEGSSNETFEDIMRRMQG